MTAAGAFEVADACAALIAASSNARIAAYKAAGSWPRAMSAAKASGARSNNEDAAATLASATSPIAFNCAVHASLSSPLTTSKPCDNDPPTALATVSAIASSLGAGTATAQPASPEIATTPPG